MTHFCHTNYQVPSRGVKRTVFCLFTGLSLAVEHDMGFVRHCFHRNFWLIAGLLAIPEEVVSALAEVTLLAVT